MGAKGLRYPERRTHPTARFGWVILSLLQVLRAVVVDASPAFGASGLWLVQPGPPLGSGLPARSPMGALPPGQLDAAGEGGAAR